MYIAFRTDASKQFGTGHFMRCFTLAIELQRYGSKIRFLSRNLPVHFIEMIKVKEMDHIPLHLNQENELTDELAHSAWLETSQVYDAQLTINALANHIFDWIVVDHYALDQRWESAVRKSCKKLMVIDDLADRVHECDLLLDQNYYADMNTRYIEKVPGHCQMLLGPRFVLLREDFGKLRNGMKQRNSVVQKILVFFGGVDVENYTGATIQALSALNCKLQVVVVIGLQHPRCEEIKRVCFESGYECHVETNRIAELMTQADLAIGAGGTALWERACLGLPTITLCLAENQRAQIADAAAHGLLYAPISENRDLSSVIRHHLISLLENPALRALISKTGMNLVNGRGTHRVARAMLSSFIKINRAIAADRTALFEWRNHFEIRKASRNSNFISFEAHKKWFDEVLGNQNRELVIGTLGNKAIGVVRFDIECDVAEVSIYIVPQSGFHGFARNLLLSAEQWLKQNRSEVRKLKAIVLSENESSKNLFVDLNYQFMNFNFLKDI
jgi:UDP-2,4-diacetamido-2,4,6-trideoxy-beta-L-altropyranose hydrolase